VVALVAGTLLLPAFIQAGSLGTASSKKGAKPISDGTGLVASHPVTPESFAPGEKERYMTQEQLDYIRPGVKIKILGITDVAAGKNPIAEITITDGLDQPLDREGKITPGPVAPGFVLARWDAAKREYFAYTTRTRNGVTNPSADQNGTWTAIETGHYTYKFGTKLPADFDATKTLTLGVYGRRTMTDIIGKDYYADNVFKDFRGDGQTASATFAAMSAATTCNKCHDPIALHGGTRREVKMCALCHTPQAALASNGETFDQKVFFHKIHMGKDLPSVQAGTPYDAGGDFSGVAFPQDIRNCTVCHEKTAAEASIWYSRPSRKACGSCHDDIDWVSGANHLAGPMSDDTLCSACHGPEGDIEFDASVKGAHTVPYKSTQLAGLKATIVSVTEAAAGKKPVVTFKLTNNAGTVLDPKNFGSNLNVVFGGPTTDYAINPLRERADGATFDGTKAVYTFKTALPADAKGTWAASIEARQTVTLAAGTPRQQNFTEGALNPVFYVSLGSGEAVARRTVVDQTKCNNCHDRLALHGGQRLVVQECVMCHNPNATDTARRPADANPPESIDMKRMIHRIHTGEELTQDYTVYGFYTPPNPPNPVGFNEVLYPGDRRNCIACHTTMSTAALPTGGVLNTVAPRDYFGTTPMGPGTTACLGCHDLRDNAAHAWLNTAPFGEACATCHGTGNDWDVAAVHAR
jgi:OmcA/MtrC family decaheme c-type cytochrome